MLVEIMRVNAMDRDAGMKMTREVEVIVDGDVVGAGTFGGEPEDNYEFRDYRWVIPLLKKMAERMGATVREGIVERE